MITLGLLKSEMREFLVNEAISSRISDWAFWVTADILSRHDFWWNKKKSSLTTVASTAEYILSPRVNGKQISYMGNEAQRGFEITERDLEDFYRFDSTPTETGEPRHWAYVDQSEVLAITTAASTVTVVSSSASDLSVNVVVRGKVGGVDLVEEIALNGTTSATGTLSFDADGFESVSLSDVCAGYITVTANSQTISQIPPGLQRIQAPRIRLWRVPSSALTLPYIYYQNAIKATKDGDIINLPNSAMKALRRGITVIGHENNGDIDLALSLDKQYNEFIAELYSTSTRELNKVYKKNFNCKDSEVVGILPRLIVGSVT
jgi:hypothetical protein